MNFFSRPIRVIDQKLVEKIIKKDLLVKDNRSHLAVLKDYINTDQATLTQHRLRSKGFGLKGRVGSVSTPMSVDGNKIKTASTSINVKVEHSHRNINHISRPEAKNLNSKINKLISIPTPPTKTSNIKHLTKSATPPLLPSSTREAQWEMSKPIKNEDCGAKDPACAVKDNSTLSTLSGKVRGEKGLITVLEKNSLFLAKNNRTTISRHLKGVGYAADNVVVKGPTSLLSNGSLKNIKILDKVSSSNSQLNDQSRKISALLNPKDLAALRAFNNNMGPSLMSGAKNNSYELLITILAALLIRNILPTSLITWIFESNEPDIASKDTSTKFKLIKSYSTESNTRRSSKMGRVEGVFDSKHSTTSSRKAEVDTLTKIFNMLEKSDNEALINKVNSLNDILIVNSKINHATLNTPFHNIQYIDILNNKLLNKAIICKLNNYISPPSPDTVRGPVREGKNKSVKSIIMNYNSNPHKAPLNIISVAQQCETMVRMINNIIFKMRNASSSLNNHQETQIENIKNISLLILSKLFKIYRLLPKTNSGSSSPSTMLVRGMGHSRSPSLKNGISDYTLNRHLIKHVDISKMKKSTLAKSSALIIYFYKYISSIISKSKKFEGSGSAATKMVRATPPSLRAREENLTHSPLLGLRLRRHQHVGVGHGSNKAGVDKFRNYPLIKDTGLAPIFSPPALRAAQWLVDEPVTGISLNKSFNLRKLFYKFNIISSHRYAKMGGIGHSQSILFNFIKNNNRKNSIDSFDYTGSLLKANISVLLKYFFEAIGPALISKPVFVFKNNIVIIQLAYFLNRSTFFFNRTVKKRLIKHWKGSSEGAKIYYKKLNTVVPVFFPIYRKRWAGPLTNSQMSVRILKNKENKIRSFINSSHSLLKSVGYKALDLKNKKYATLKVIKKFTKIKHIFNKTDKDKIYSFFINSFNLKKKPSQHNIPNYVTIFKQNRILHIFKEYFNALTFILEKFFKCPVQLELTRLFYPYFDSNILAQIININGKDYVLNKIINLLFSRTRIRNPNRFLKRFDWTPKTKNSLVSYLSGVKIRVAGRFYNQRIIPRKTVFTTQRGSLARGVIKFVDSSRYTNKTKRGSFSVTVSISHIF